jgi:hypothetical protein
MQPKHAPKEEDQPFPQENNIQFYNSFDVNCLLVFYEVLAPLRIPVDLECLLFQDDLK